MKIIKCEVEIDDDREFKFLGFQEPKKGEYYYIDGEVHRSNLDWCNGQTLCFELIEPPLELETDYFMSPGSPVTDRIIEVAGDRLFVGGAIYLGTGERNDLIKILEYYNKNKKLPDRVVLKEQTK